MPSEHPNVRFTWLQHGLTTEFHHSGTVKAPKKLSNFPELASSILGLLLRYHTPKLFCKTNPSNTVDSKHLIYSLWHLVLHSGWWPDCRQGVYEPSWWCCTPGPQSPAICPWGQCESAPHSSCISSAVKVINTCLSYLLFFIWFCGKM